MADVLEPIPAWRLNLLRAGYLLIAVGLALTVWPALFAPATDWTSARGVQLSLLAAISLLAVVGVRLPLTMLPLLLFELVWKTIWLLKVALPAWMSGDVSPATAENTFACALVVIFLPLIPWRYVWDSYMRGAEPWRTTRMLSGAAPTP